MKIKKNYIWVIERLSVDKWETTVGVSLTRKSCIEEKKDYWENNYPYYKLRIRKYICEGE